MNRRRPLRWRSRPNECCALGPLAPKYSGEASAAVDPAELLAGVEWYPEPHLAGSQTAFLESLSYQSLMRRPRRIWEVTVEEIGFASKKMAMGKTPDLDARLQNSILLLWGPEP
ncbi:hypothetical protein NDU88_009071 [Pleurodeles waltl]|uniref:Uncharacterized protein n=1 Tax=Pleurodeles waltl TaxID=8319 RepID=A0AAV7RZZ2_PLEWA|nr:hypothetical protein NDU88_009071 [Pleurodeles waltl]